jgi:hypothetical protein
MIQRDVNGALPGQTHEPMQKLLQILNLRILLRYLYTEHKISYINSLRVDAFALGALRGGLSDSLLRVRILEKYEHGADDRWKK